MSAGSPRGPQLTGTPLKLHSADAPAAGIFSRIELRGNGDEQVHVTVAVVIDEGAARCSIGPCHRASPASRVTSRECAVAVVAVQDVAGPNK